MLAQIECQNAVAFGPRITSLPLTFPLLINLLKGRRTKPEVKKLHFCKFSNCELKCARSISYFKEYNDYKMENNFIFHVSVFAFDARQIFGHDF